MWVGGWVTLRKVGVAHHSALTASKTILQEPVGGCFLFGCNVNSMSVKQKQGALTGHGPEFGWLGWYCALCGSTVDDMGVGLYCGRLMSDGDGTEL